MKFLIRWTIPTLLLAAILHLSIAWLAPGLISNIMAIWIRKDGGIGWNKSFRNSLPASDISGLFISPDIIYSQAIYNVEKGPVRLHCAIPKTGNYWSVSLYDWNLANFFVENDLTVPKPEFDLIITGSSTARYQPRGNERVVVSPTTKGVVFTRAVVSSRENKAELDLITAAQKKSAIELLVP